MILRTSASRLGLALALALGVAIAMSAASPARADTANTSAIAQLMVVESGHKDYKSFHGAVWIDHDKATTNYRWGGAQCSGRDISESTVQLLFAALRSGDQVTLEYVLSEVKGKQYRCVTAVVFSKT